MSIKRFQLFVLTSFFWALFVALSFFNFNGLGLLNIVGFLALILIPGLLTILSLKIARGSLFWKQLAQIVGLSILEIMMWELGMNTLLPYFGIVRPLDHSPLLICLTGMYLITAGICWRPLKHFNYSFGIPKFEKVNPDFLAVCAPMAFVILSIMGAVSLNNGGTNVFTLIMLIGMSGYIGLLLIFRERISDNAFAWSIYMMGASLLFMTSLRGWYVTGHDIQREYKVFELAKQAGNWNIGSFRDPYNACLSITILPVVFANTLHMADQYVYKVLFQLIFAITPVGTFLFARRYLSKAYSLLVTVYFISFPTFFTDMPFLNRQEIAFLFLSLILLIVFDGRISRYKRQVLFLLFSLGVVLSHYSTTYSLIAILVLLVICRLIFQALQKRLQDRKVLWRSSLRELAPNKSLLAPFITIPMVIGVLALCVLWNSVFTDTSNAATSLFRQTLESITSGINEDAKSNDVLYSIFSSGSANPFKELQSYEKNVVQPAREADPNSYYPSSLVDKYPLSVQTTSNSPLTAFGNFLNSHHVNVSTLNSLIKQSWAKLLQVFVGVGVVYAFFRRKYSHHLEAEMYILAIASMVFVLAQLALPYLSVAYGLLRAFQQSLMILGLFLVIGTVAITFGKKQLRFVPAGLAIFFFLASTSVISQLLGGYSPQLHLNNTGQYYDIYYMHKSEVIAIDWLSGTVSSSNSANNVQSEVQTDRYALSKVSSISDLQPLNDITPGLIRKNSYVFLGFTDVTKQQATVSYNSDLVTYSYPIEFLNNSKNLIYNNGTSEIYR